MSIIDEVDKFMSSPISNAWIGDDNLRVYVRKGHHFINGSLINTFDVANISNEPEHRGKGYFKTFMIKVESLNLPVFVECILNSKLTDMLARNGYTVIEQNQSIHAYKFPENQLCQ